MHVPLVIAGPGVDAGGVSDTPVSTRRIFHTILDWAGIDAAHSLRGADAGEVVLGEAMKPFLEYGWQPQVMAVAGKYKAILAGKIETYDLAADPGEMHDLGNSVQLCRPGCARRSRTIRCRRRTRRAPPRTSTRTRSAAWRASATSAPTAAPVVRKDAPRPADMMPLLATLEKASGLFAAGKFAESIPLLEQVLAADPHNLDAALRLATAHSSLGHEQQAEELFRRAAAIAPQSQDVRTYLALHYARTKDWPRAVPLLEQVVTESPDRLTAVEALASLRVRQGQQAMDAGQTGEAIAAFERARALQPAAFKNDLELGVLYLASRRYDDARAALDRALARPSRRCDDALQARAGERAAERARSGCERIAAARQQADATTRPLIERERLSEIAASSPAPSRSWKPEAGRR